MTTGYFRASDSDGRFLFGAVHDIRRDTAGVLTPHASSKRNVLTFLTACCDAARDDMPPPSLFGAAAAV